MIAIACATTDEQAFRVAGATTMEALDEMGSVLLRRHGDDPVGACNAMLAEVSDRSDLEAVVLVHQDAIADRAVPALQQIRGLLAVEDVAVVGTVDGGRARDVATVDGTLVALSPWAVRSLRLDPGLGASVDAAIQDLSLQARAAGRRVVGAPLGVVRVAPARAGRVARRAQLAGQAELRRRWELDPA